MNALLDKIMRRLETADEAFLRALLASLEAPVYAADITENYHGGNAQSAAAHRRTNKQRDANELYALVYRCGKRGCTADEADIALGKGHQTTSARFSDLKAAGHIVGTGVTRPTRKNCSAEVYVAATPMLNRAATRPPRATPPAASRNGAPAVS